MPLASTMRLTARQLLTPEDPPGARLELVNGRIAVSPGARPEHSWVDRQVTRFLLNHISKHDLGRLIGDVDTVFGKHEVCRPDIIYYTKERLHLIKRGDALRSPPDLCIEIIGPGSRKIDRLDKFVQYAKGGVPFYWIIDPLERTIEVFHLIDERYELSSSGRDADVVSLQPFEDLKLPLSPLWMPRGTNAGQE